MSSQFWRGRRTRRVGLVIGVMLFGSSCTSVSEPAIVIEPVVDAEPAPTAAPTAGPTPEPPSSTETGEPESDDSPAAVILDQPETSVFLARHSVGDVAFVDYSASISESSMALADGVQPVAGFAADGRHRWVAIPNGSPECDGLMLGRVDLDTGNIDPLTVNGTDLNDIVAVHRGPGDLALLESGCGKYGGPQWVARLNDDATIADVAPVTGLAGQLWMWEPWWGWTDDGRATVTVPMAGATTDAIHDVIDATSGATIESIGSEVIQLFRLRDGWDDVTFEFSDGEGFDVLINGTPMWSGIIQATASDETNLVVGGASETLWIRGGGLPPDSPSVQTIGLPSTSLALSPGGAVLAIATATSIELHSDAGTTTLATVNGHELAFSDDGTRLSAYVSQGEGWELRTWTFDHAGEDPTTIVPGTTLSSAGLGPIRVGMSLGEIESATELSFRADTLSDFEPGACFWASSDGLADVSLLGMATSGDPSEGIVMRVSTTSPLFPTPSGIRVGDLREKVLALFPGQIDELAHQYTPGNYLDFVPADPDETTTVRFETLPGGQIDRILVGVMPWPFFVEGCA